ncbi:MAG: hypothetical protein J3Q66DRAFT_382615 [Benniella sp.]|nr:MAG: hypothetical protein J3Q66DRAFT_382615 [Benniella sp.]
MEHTLKGPGLPTSFLKDSKSSSHDAKEKKKKDNTAHDLSRMIVASTALMRVASPGALSPDRKGSISTSTSQRSIPSSIRTSFSSISGSISGKNKSSAASPHPPGLLPSVLPRNSIDNTSDHSHSSSSHSHSHSHSHSKLSFLRRLRPHHPTDSPSSPSHKSNLHQYTITMAPQHDIHITWPHPVPSGNVCIAGTFPVLGHQKWDKIPMTRIPGSQGFEVHLNIQEEEDITDYLDDEGYTHHALDHHNDTTTPSSPSTASPQRTSKSEKIKRFFGRARSSSTSSNHHPDLPYHHQSKDGVITPLTKEYRYQYKFVIDDQWQCDNFRHQVQDESGNFNHEFVATLVEQIHQPPTPNRSRSSSIQSQHSVQASSVLGQQQGGIDKIEEDVQKESLHDVPQLEAAPATLPPAAVDSSSSPPAAAEASSPSSSPSQKSKDSYEPVILLNVSDDLSDGEGRGKNIITDSDDDHDHDMDSHNHNNNNSVAIEETDGIGKRAPEETHVVVAPQQDQGKDNKVELLSTTTSAAAAAEETTITNIPGEDIVNPLPSAAAEESLAATTVSPLAKEEEEEKEEEKLELHQPEVISAETAVPSSSSLSSSEGAPLETIAPVAESIAEDEDKAEPYFVLQPAAELDAPAVTTTTTTTATTESIRQNNRAPRQPLEVVTDAPAPGNYSQVPSPPLTPNSAPNMKDLLGESQEAKEKEEVVVVRTAARETTIPPTPVADLPPAGKLTLFTETKETTQNVELNEPHVRDDASELSFDVLDDHHDHDQVIAGKVHLEHHHHHHHHHRHHDHSEQDETKSVASLDEDSNLFWSLCKTTAVVSAAVVVLGLGLGRKRH